MRTTDRTASELPAVSKPELLGTVFSTGAAVMVIEILGTRIIGPVFGVSLFVWAALLAVTLASLAAGCYAGGVAVDRSPTPRLPGLVVTLAGVFLGLGPIARRLVLGVSQDLGPRWGPLLSAALLFAPTLAALGMVGPIAVKLATDDLRTAGHRVGAIYAVSTAGSLIGTLITAFGLVPSFETNRILVGTSLFLVVWGVVLLLRQGRRGATAAILVPFLSLAVPSAQLPQGIAVVDRAQSLYGLVEVIDDTNRNVKFLRADHSVIGAQFLGDRSTGFARGFAFLHQMEALRFFRPGAKDLLQIGLGIGSVPMSLRPYGIKSDVIDVDPAVVRFAQQYFGFATSGAIHVEDARTFLRRTSQQYDLIAHDPFTGGATPEHLLSVEVLRTLHGILRPGGVLALNFAGYQRGLNVEAGWAVARTLRAVFANVRAFRDTDLVDRPDDVANTIFFASDGSLYFTIPAAAKFESAACEATIRALPRREIFQSVPPGPIVTDELNPLARLQLATADGHFRAMNMLLPKEVWLD